MTLNSGTPLSPLLRLGYKCVLQSSAITNVNCAFHKGDLEITKENLEKAKAIFAVVPLEKGMLHCFQ